MKNDNTNILNTEGICPDCGNGIFLHGPCGGEAENIRCIGCDAEFNFCPPFTPERIDRNEPNLYHGTFRPRQDLIDAGFIKISSVKSVQSWWKRILLRLGRIVP